VAGVRTGRQRRGASAELEAVAHLEQAGWRVVVRNLKVGRDELDIVAVDPGPPRTLVVVEVRSVRTSAFGAPEARVDRAKVSRLYRAVAALGDSLETDDQDRLLPRRVDLVIVDRRSWPTQIRHLRSLEPP
jgi:putative endonuclease